MVMSLPDRRLTFRTMRPVSLLTMTMYAVCLLSLDAEGDLLPPNTATEPLPEAEVARVVAQAYPDDNTIVHAEGSRTFDEVSDHTLGEQVRVYFRASSFGHQYCRRRVTDLFTKSGDEIRDRSEFDYVARRDGAGVSCDDVPRDRFFQFSHGFGEELEAHILDIALAQFQSFVRKLDELPHEPLIGQTKPGCKVDDIPERAIRSIHYQKLGPRKMFVRYTVDHICTQGTDDERSFWFALLIQDKYTDRQHKNWEWTDYELGMTVF